MTSIRFGSSTRTTPASGAPLNEWHTVNGTGVIGAPPVSVTSASEGTKGADGDDEANVIGGARPGTDAGGGEVDYGDVADGEDEVIEGGANEGDGEDLFGNCEGEGVLPFG